MPDFKLTAKAGTAGAVPAQRAGGRAQRAPLTKKTPAIRIFSHLSDEERIDQACELLARGVLRLAEKRGLTKPLHPKACERPKEMKPETET